MKIVRVLTLGLLGFCNGPVWAGTCSLCRETLRMGSTGNLINGFYWSIVLILIVPLAVIALGVRYALKHYS